MGSEQFSAFYRELADVVGEKAAVRLWKRYGGLAVTFPRQLYSREYVRSFIEENAGKMKAGDIARFVDLTERRVRQIIREMKENSCDSAKEEKR